MLIELKKFGTTLSSRNDGQEAFRAIVPVLREMAEGEDLILDFFDINTFTPAWGDEVVFGLFKKYGGKLILKNTTANRSVQETLGFLAEINKVEFNIA